MNNRYPKVNYIGNKEKIADWIISNFPITNGVVLDLFSGGCSVSYKLKEKGFQVFSNDILYSNFCLSKAIIENNHDTLDLKLKEEDLKELYTKKTFKDIAWLSNKLYFKNEVEELVSLVNFSYSLKEYDNFIFLALLRRAMIRKIPYSRMTMKWEEIVKLRDEELSYKKYGRRRAYHNIPFLQHIYQNIQSYNNAVFDNGKQNTSYNLDCFEMIDNIEHVDLIYLDPPYPSTMNNYVGFYGGFDRMFKQEIKSYTDFTNSKYFLETLCQIIEKCESKTSHITISINNKSKPNPDEIISILQKRYSRIEKIESKHTYKVTNKINKNATIETMIILEI